MVWYSFRTGKFQIHPQNDSFDRSHRQDINKDRVELFLYLVFAFYLQDRITKFLIMHNSQQNFKPKWVETFLCFEQHYQADNSSLNKGRWQS